jgi:hypothetical protein
MHTPTNNIDASMQTVMGRMLLEEVKKERCDFDKALRLIAEGASLKERDKENDRSPLEWVAWNGHPPLLAVAMLHCDTGEKPVFDDHARRRAIATALARGNFSVAKGMTEFIRDRKYQGYTLTAQYGLPARRGTLSGPN